MPKLFSQSKAKAALAKTNPSNAELPVDAETRISALEGDTHTHSSLTALNYIYNKANFIFSTNGFGMSVAKKTGNYTASSADSVILCDATSGSFTITLPQASTVYDGTHLAGIEYTIVKTDESNNTITIDPNGSETIFGNSEFILLYENESVNIITDGIEWFLKD